MEAYRDRMRLLNQKPCNMYGKYVLYWCQSAIRSSCNLALEYAKHRANWHKAPLVACIGIKMPSPWCTERHCSFMLEAIREFHGYLGNLGINLLIVNDSPDKTVTLLSKDAIEILVDMNYLKIHRFWYKNAADNVPCSMTQIETNSVVPVEIASSKEELDLEEFREKILKMKDRFIRSSVSSPFDNGSQLPIFKSVQKLDDEWFINRVPEAKFVDINRNIGDILLDLDLDRSIKKAQAFSGGYLKARDKLEAFIAHGLQHYDSIHRDNPIRVHTSKLSPYLTNGHISPIEVVQRVQDAKICDKVKETFLNRVFILRELSINVIWYNKNYDSLFGCNLPKWAMDSIKRHDNDPRPFIYSKEQLQRAETYDRIWNAAQTEMVVTGRMHSILRVYWGKRIMEWSPSAQQAFETMITLNDMYHLDGCDPCSFCGIALCFGKFAQKSHVERPIFGHIQALYDWEIVDIYGKAAVDKYVDVFSSTTNLKIENCSIK